MKSMRALRAKLARFKESQTGQGPAASVGRTPAPEARSMKEGNKP